MNSWIQNAASKFMNIESWVRLHFCWVNNMLSQKSKNCNHLDMFHMILLRISVSDHKPRVEPKRCNFWASKPIFPCPFMFCCCGFHFISSKVIFYLKSVSIYCIDTCIYIYKIKYILVIIYNYIYYVYMYNMYVYVCIYIYIIPLNNLFPSRSQCVRSHSAPFRSGCSGAWDLDVPDALTMDCLVRVS